MHLHRIADITKSGCWQMCLAFAVLLLWVSTASAKLAWVHIEIVQTKTGQWVYELDGVHTRRISEAELADLLKTLSNPNDGILLSLHSNQFVPTDQIIKILEMAKANPEGIEIAKIECGPFN